jgi:hypothetical protein
MRSMVIVPAELKSTIPIMRGRHLYQYGHCCTYVGTDVNILQCASLLLSFILAINQNIGSLIVGMTSDIDQISQLSG